MEKDIIQVFAQTNKAVLLLIIVEFKVTVIKLLDKRGTSVVWEMNTNLPSVSLLLGRIKGSWSLTFNCCLAFKIHLIFSFVSLNCISYSLFSLRVLWSRSNFSNSKNSEELTCWALLKSGNFRWWVWSFWLNL